MRVPVTYGRSSVELNLPDQQLVSVHREPLAEPLDDPMGAVRFALENPRDFPPLWRALTPDDHLAIVVDEQMPHLTEILTTILDHVSQAQVAAESVTLLVPHDSAGQTWLDDLPEQWEEVRIEVHNPADRKRLSYLATTKKDRRVYLNRTLVDADQVVVLTTRGYSPLGGYSGAETTLFTTFSDEGTRNDLWSRLSLAVPTPTPSAFQQEAAEVAWLLGMPFLLQVIEGTGNEICHVLGGPLSSSQAGMQLLDGRWRVQVDEPVDTVIVSLGADPRGHDFFALARALACAARVVKTEGRIILLSEGRPALGTAAHLLRRAGDPKRALLALQQHQAPDRIAGFLWASAVQQATVYLLSGLETEEAEELFTTPLENAEQVQRLLGGGSYVILPDAHKTMAEIQTSVREGKS